jgi:hypothetical protein
MEPECSRSAACLAIKNRILSLSSGIFAPAYLVDQVYDELSVPREVSREAIYPISHFRFEESEARSLQQRARMETSSPMVPSSDCAMWEFVVPVPANLPPQTASLPPAGLAQIFEAVGIFFRPSPNTRGGKSTSKEVGMPSVTAPRGAEAVSGSHR